MSGLGMYYGTGSTEVTGERGWVFDDETGLLRSGADGSIWSPGEAATATCQSHRFAQDFRLMSRDPEKLEEGPHPAPNVRCSCGIHAYREGTLAPLSAEVEGEVRLWGKVVQHAGGSRASHAYPSRLRVHEDGAADGPERAARIVEQLRAYGVPVAVAPHEVLDALIASELRAARIPAGLARIGRIAWTAREDLDAGHQDRAFGGVLDELRSVDLRTIYPGHQMGQGLPGPALLHSRTSRRWVSDVKGNPGDQVITVMSLNGAPAMYYGPQRVVLDTRTGAIEERFSQCAGPRHRGHESWPQHRESEITIARISPLLRLETWIQLLTWQADPRLRASAAALRLSR